MQSLLMRMSDIMSDIYIVILSIIILILLVILTSFILKKLVLDVNNEAKKEYLLNVSRYEEEMKKTINSKEETKIINPFTDDNESNNDNKIYVSDVCYKGESVLKKAKQIEERFNADDETIIKYFLKCHLTMEDLTMYQNLLKIKGILQSLEPCNLVKKVDKNILLKKVPNDVRIILESLYCSQNKISALELLDTIEEEIKKYDPRVYVYAGNKASDYKTLDARIITRYDENIYRGVKIYYHNQLYDYSIE